MMLWGVNEKRKTPGPVLLLGHQITKIIPQGSVSKIFYRHPHHSYTFYSCDPHAFKPDKAVFFSHFVTQRFAIRIICFVCK